MSASVGGRLAELARADATVAPLAWLQVEAWRAAADRAWAAAVPPLDAARLSQATPLLHGQTLAPDIGRVRRLLERLAVRAGELDLPVGTLRQALKREALDLPALLGAALTLDTARLEALAATADAPPGLLATLAGLASLPLLQACGAQALPLLQAARWDAGWCPVCAAWPALAELRGLERARWLRCGRCGVGWAYPHNRCVFCGTWSEGAQHYLAAEDTRDARRAITCGSCAGYLKTVATIGALAAEEVAVQDLATVELDMAALGKGCTRPDGLGFPLQVGFAPARASGWRGWGR